MRTDPLADEPDDHLESRFQHRFRWAAVAGVCICLATVPFMSLETTRYFSACFMGYMLHGFVHSLDMTMDYRKLTRSWATLNRYREKLKVAEQHIMSGSEELKS